MITVDRFAGCLIGQALGDALGFPVEGYPPETCSRYVNESLRTGHVEQAVRPPYGFGQYTDDTQLARELAVSLIACRGLQPPDYASRIAEIFTSQRIVGRGRATEEAALRIAAGVPWQESGAPAPTAGNGSAMRAAPIGLAYSSNAVALVTAAQQQGHITHQDRRCAAGAVAIAGATALAAQAAFSTSADNVYWAKLFCDTLADWTWDLDVVLASAIASLPSTMLLPRDEAFEVIGGMGVEPGHDNGWEGISPFVTPSVLWSLYAFMCSPNNYWEAICTAIAVGGDVDTTAAMTGAISGAAVGLSGLPAKWARMVTDRGEWGYEELLGIAVELHKLSDSPLPEPRN